MSPQFARTPNPAPLSAELRGEILADPGFGRHFTDHMVTIRWTADAGWHDAAVVPYGPLTLDPATMVLHYGQEIFEGLKAYRRPTARSPRSGRRRTRPGSAARRAASRWRSCPTSCSSRRSPSCSPSTTSGCRRRRRGRALPAAVHAGHRGRAGRAAVGRVPVRADRLAGRPVLRGRREADRRVALHRVHARRAGRHRHRQVRRQLRGLAAPAGAGRGARLRAGGLPRRRGAHAGWTRWARTTCSSCTARASRPRSSRPPSPAASSRASRATRSSCWPRSWAARSASGASPGRNGSRARLTARSPRSSAAAPQL